MKNQPNIDHIPHIGLLVRDTRRALDFYCGVLQLPLLARPELGYPGAWLAVGAQQIHLMELPSPDPVQGRPAHGGRDRHIALAVKNIADLKAILNEADVPITVSKSGRAALFCRDPDGNALEFVQWPL